MKEKSLRELESYPLVVFNSDREKYKFADAKILIGATEINYFVDEIKLDKNERDIYFKVLRKIKKDDKEKNILRYDKKTAFDFILKEVRGASKKLNHYLSAYEEKRIAYFVFRNYVGLGEMEPLIHDKNIKYILCERPCSLIYIFHKNPRYGFLKTNIKFKNLFEFNTAFNNLKLRSKVIRNSPDFLGVFDNDKLVELSDTHNEISISTVSRIPISPKDMLNLKIATKSMLSYLSKIIKNKGSILIIGGNEYQRTEIANSLAFFVKKGAKTVIFEKYPNTIVPQEDLYKKVLTPYKKKHAAIIEYYLRKNPSFVIADGINEIKLVVKNIKKMCQTFITLDAQSFDDAMNKLNKKLPAPTIANIDVVILIRNGINGWPRIEEIYEISEYDAKLKKIKVTPIFFWNKMYNKLIIGKSKLLS